MGQWRRALPGAGREPAAAAARSPFTVSWGGLVVLGDDDDAAAAKAERLGAGDHVIVGGPDLVADALRAYVDAGAEWLMIGPVDSSDPENARILGEEILPRLRSAEEPAAVTARAVSRWNSAGSTRCRRTSSGSWTP